jgi:hypothetical protein
VNIWLAFNSNDFHDKLNVLLFSGTAEQTDQRIVQVTFESLISP